MKTKQRLRNSQEIMLSCNRVTIRKLANLIDNPVVSFPSVTIEPSQQRHLIKVKITALK